MDIQMPEMNGYEATGHIINTMGLNIPIIAMTADNNECERRKCSELGMCDYVTKPFRQEELFSAISLTIKNRNNINIMQERNITDKSSSESKEFKRRYNKFGTSEAKKSNKIYFTHFISSGDKKRHKTSFLSSIKERVESVNRGVLKDYSGDDNELEKELIEAFIKDFPSYMHSLEEHIMNRNYIEIQKLAHKMKSGVSYFGLNRVKRSLIEIEEFSKMADINLIKPYFEIIKYNLNQNISELRLLLNNCYKF
jgi:CheY-like chemotaxis protein